MNPLALFFTATATAMPTLTRAQAGQPIDWQMTMQVPVTETAQNMVALHNGILWAMTGIVVLVGGLLLYAIIRFREREGRTPSKVSHNTWLEVAWTVVPILILVAIAIPSFRILKHELTIPEPDIVVKATGYAWYWSYEYPDHEISFDSFMLSDEEALERGEPRLLAVDRELVVPVGKVVKVQVTAGDVIHAFAVPSFGLKIDAIPGRLNETWFKAEREGIYYGQCSELCGALHAFMPIAVRVVGEAEFAQWLDENGSRIARSASVR